MLKALRTTLVVIAFLFVYSVDAQTKNIKVSKSAFAPKYSLPKGEILYVNGQATMTGHDLKISLLDQSNDSLVVHVESGKTASTATFGEGNKVTSLYIGEGASLHVNYKDWDTSPLAIPIKIRPATQEAPLEFVGEFTLGSYIGYQRGSKSISNNETYNYSQTFSAFAAPTMIKINPEVADTDMSNLVLGFSLGLGYIVNLNAFQIGLVGGIDYISGDVSKTWIYQGKPWFSFTIGFDFNDEEIK